MNHVPVYKASPLETTTYHADELSFWVSSVGIPSCWRISLLTNARRSPRVTNFPSFNSCFAFEMIVKYWAVVFDVSPATYLRRQLVENNDPLINLGLRAPQGLLPTRFSVFLCRNYIWTWLVDTLTCPFNNIFGRFGFLAYVLRLSANKVPAYQISESVLKNICRTNEHTPLPMDAPISNIRGRSQIKWNVANEMAP